MIGVLPLKKRSPFVFPGGKPGVDRNHPACKKFLRFSGVASGAHFIRVDKAVKGTVTATISTGIDGTIGPYVKNNGTTGRIAFAGNSTVAPTSCTLAAIVVTPASGGFSSWIGITSSTTAACPNLMIDSGTNKFSMSSFTGTPNLISSIVFLPNTPYFVAASYNLNGSGNVNFVVTNLSTGRIQTSTVANTFAATASNGTYCVCGNAGDPATDIMSAAMYSTAGLSLAELVAWANDPWSFWYPRQDLTNMLAAPSGGGSVSGTLAATDTPDIAAFAGDVVLSAALAATDTTDTAAFNGLVAIPATLAATESPDVAAFNGFVGVSGTLATTDTTDTAAFNGSVLVSGTLATTDTSDIAAFNGDVIVSGTLAVTESTDTAAFNGSVLVSGTLVTTDTQDIAAFSGTIGNVVSGALAVTETTDIAALAGDVVISAALAVTDTTDVASFSGSVLVSGTLAVTDTQDIAAFSGTVLDVITGSFAVTESQDTASFSGVIASTITGTLAVTESQDTAFFQQLIGGGSSTINWKKWREEAVQRKTVSVDISKSAKILASAGGHARAASLTSKQRITIASNAAKARWN